MPSYHVVITGHIKPDALVEGLKPKMHQVWNYDVDTTRELMELTNARASDILTGNGMLVRDDPFNIKVGRVDLNKKWVPLTSIAYLSQTIIPMVGELPYIDQNGNIVVKSGKEIVLQ